MVTLLKHSILATLALGSLVSQTDAKSWQARPIVVHEWGVNLHDWRGDPQRAKHDPELPPYFYTDEKPGKAFPAAAKVKNFPPDSGIRFKPLLYFYGDGPIGFEARFEYGHANAWYPQVNVYRDPEMVKDAKAVDWSAWQKNEQPLNILSSRFSPVPDDPRYELVWHHLILDPKLTPNAPAPSQEHWLNIARDVDAITVSNGKEHEKFIFYEGATTELPAITIVPTDQKKTYQLLNTSKHPIYDVYVIYKKGDQRYVKYHPELKQGLEGVSFPNFSTEKFTTLTEKEFQKQTTQHLVKKLSTADKKSTKNGVINIDLTEKSAFNQPYNGKFNVFDQPFMMRDPADRQASTLGHILYKKEAEGLEKIWRKDFFQQEGLTIIYRESPTYLDEAMPLNIYTDMYHYIQLNRCGLVCNSNIDLDKISAVYQAAPKLLYGRMTEMDSKLCRDNLILAKTYLQYLSLKIQNLK